MNFELYGISEELLKQLSYESKLGKSLKNTLRKFDRQDIINELLDVKEFYESTELLKNSEFSYRVKSIQSCILKYNKYYPSTEVNKCYNDLLGILLREKYDNNEISTVFKLLNVEDLKKEFHK